MALADGYLDRETGLLKISWSRLRVMEECRQKGHLKSTLPPGKIEDVRNFFQGNVCDLAMRRWLELGTATGPPPSGWMADQVDSILDESEKNAEGVIKWRHSNDRAQVRRFCLECVTRLEPLLLTMVVPYLYQPAVRFKARVVIPGLDSTPTPVLVTGEMDVLTCEPGAGVRFPLAADTMPARGSEPPRLRVWDLKATKDGQYWRKTSHQLVFYDIACLAMFGTTAVEVGLLQPMIEAHPYISFVPSDQDRIEMFGRIINVAHAIWREDFSPKASTEGCNRCEVRHACIRYQPVAGSKRVML